MFAHRVNKNQLGAQLKNIFMFQTGLNFFLLWNTKGEGSYKLLTSIGSVKLQKMHNKSLKF